MSLSDHVVVMNGGRIEQQGLPHEIYERPATQFVADFIGVTNLVPGEVAAAEGDSVRVRLLGAELALPAGRGPRLAAGQRVQVVIRPEHLHLQDADGAGSALAGEVASVSYLGAAASYQVRLAGGQLLTVQDPAPRGAALRSPGERVGLRLETDRAYVLPA